MEKVDILLSVFNPNEEFLKKQLISLNEQSWDNIEILIYDDCVDKRCNPDIFERYLQKKKWKLLPYQDKNLKYTKAFEELVRKSTGEYVAFCDQDDIWDYDKIEKCVEVLKRDHTDLVATDKRLIDENDKVICPSVRERYPKPENTWNTYDDIGKYNFFVTYAIGMTLVMCGDFARSTIPFSPYTGHDKWVIACAAANRNVSFLDEPLVSYRRHSNNVSGVLKGVYSKDEYVKKRAEPHFKLVKEFMEKYPDYLGASEAYNFAEARCKHDVFRLIKYRYLAKDIAKFEILLAITPDFLFRYVIVLVKRIMKSK